MRQAQMDFNSPRDPEFKIMTTSGKEWSGNGWIVTERYMITKVGGHGSPVPAEDCDYRSKAFAQARCDALNSGKIKIGG
jgi:hypothetical protein